MKSLFLILLLALSMSVSAQVAINNDGSQPDPSAMLDVSSTSRGLLPPRMTQAQRIAITNPVVGLIMWCSDCGAAGELQVYNGTTWTNMIGGEAGATFPILTTTIASPVDGVTATSGGNITFDGGSAVTERGVCWSTTSNPTIAETKTTDGNGSGIFESALTELIPNTTYYVRAYATNSRGTAYGNEVSFTSLSFSIGLSYGGGIIFYTDGTGLHGLISATTDQSTYLQWFNGSYIATGATGTAIGTGNTNTNTIVGVQGNYGNYAARICYNLTTMGLYDDWFLPSKDELNLMYQQKSVIGGFADIPYNSYYWSSSETDLNNAWEQGFVLGDQYADPKAVLSHVRAIRAF
jgi:hypothetical protein